MDFRNTNVQPDRRPLSGNVAAPAPTPTTTQSEDSLAKWLRASAVALLFCLTMLVVGTIGVIAFSDARGSDQNKFVNASQYQAVFLTNGQVYFGDITRINSDYIKLQNIYYLTQNTTTDSKGNATTSGNYTLVKLGCQQIHDPVDEMIIERSQVSFWENLNSSGKVVGKIKEFQQQNPKGPDCSQVSNQTQASSNTNTQGSNSSTNTKQ